MIHEKQNPVAIDAKIQLMQQKMYQLLPFKKMNAFGRVYLIKNKDNKNIPAEFISGTDYKEIVFNDSNNVHFFCIENEETVQSGTKYETEVEWIFAMNVKKLKPQIQHRADEECLVDILTVIKRIPYFKVDKIYKGEKALEDFDTTLEDRHPMHFIKIVGKLKYSINC